MKRPLGYLLLVAAVCSALGATFLARAGSGVGVGLGGDVGGVTYRFLLVRGLSGAAVLLGSYGLYLLVTALLRRSAVSKRRRHDVTNVVHLRFGVATAVSLLGVVAEQWVGLLFSLGVVGFAVTFALQQPLFSLLGWGYIIIERPYQVGDLVPSNQPSGRIITLPNSVVLSSHVKNYTREEFPYVWNEIAVQVAYETDMPFARETTAGVADDLLGEQMERRIDTYRERLAETPVELEVQDRPSVNVVQKESWVELRLRYLVDPKRGQRTKNELYEQVMAAFNAEPERVRLPAGRNR